MKEKDLERIVLRAIRRHEKSIEKREKQIEEYIGLRDESLIKSVERLLRFEKRLRLVGVETFHEAGKGVRGIFPSATTDWDFYDPTITLEPSDYISPPSCLEFPEYIYNTALCKVPETLNLPEGRLVTWVKCGYDWLGGDVRIQFAFRDQSPEGSVERLYGYDLTFDVRGGLIVFERDWGGAKLATIEAVGLPPIAEWCIYRITWFSSPNGLEVHLEFPPEPDMDFVLFKVFTDPENLYIDSSINRCGISHESDIAGGWTRWDDTEIWAPV